MRTAITRQPAASLAECELTFIDRQPIDVDLARRQHTDYCAALRRLGVDVVTLPPAEDLPDSVFVEDVAVIFDELAVIGVPGAASRRAEAAALEPEIARLRPVARLQSPGTLDGGDVLRVGRTVYAGLSSRTNAAGVAALLTMLSPYGYRVIPVPVVGSLHLKTAVTALDSSRLLANPAWVDIADLSGFEVIPVPPGEPFAANVLRIGDTLLMNAACPEAIRLVERLGFAVCPVDISEFAKAEGGLTCLSLVFD